MDVHRGPAGRRATFDLANWLPLTAHMLLCEVRMLDSLVSHACHVQSGRYLTIL